MKTLSETELKQITWAHLRDATGYLGNESEISQERAASLRGYLGEPYGDERDGRSRVVSRDILETVEWILPSLMRVFCSGDDVVRFEPQGPEDEESAKQATDYINYCFWKKKNSGFLTLHTWFKDALVQKTGVVKYFWDEKVSSRVETYVNQEEAAYIELVTPDDVTVLEHTDNEDGTHDVKIKRMVRDSYACIMPVPPEEFLISRRARNIMDSPFCAHRVLKSRAELIAEGYDEKTVKDLPAYHNKDNTEEEVVRWQRDDDEELVSAHWSMEEVEVYECYIDVDYDDDGIAEIVKVVLAGGEAGKLLAHEMVEEKPFASICPVPLSHKFFGLSIADLMQDLQRIKSVLWRNYMDGTYLATTPQREVQMNKLEKGGLDDLLNQKIGGIIRVKEIGAVREVKYPDVGPQALTALEYTDKVRQDRTGVVPGGSALDQEALQNQSATAVNKAAEDAAQRVELIARIFAETGVKDLFQGLLRLVVRHQPKEEIVRLRGKWVPVDTAAWNSDMDATCEVGLGHGNRERLVGMLMEMLRLQNEALMAGMPYVTPDNIYASLEKLTAWTGLGAVEPYFTDPSQAEPKPPQPDPLMLEMKAKQAESQAKLQLQAQDIQSKQQLEQWKAGKEVELKRAEASERIRVMRETEEAKRETELIKIQTTFETKREEMLLAAQHRAEELEKEAALELIAIKTKAASGNGIIPDQ